MASETVIQDLIRSRNGYLYTADAVAKGISRVALGDYVEKHALERVSYGTGDHIFPSTREPRGIDREAHKVIASICAGS